MAPAELKRAACFARSTGWGPTCPGSIGTRRPAGRAGADVPRRLSGVLWWALQPAAGSLPVHSVKGAHGPPRVPQGHVQMPLVRLKLDHAACAEIRPPKQTNLLSGQGTDHSQNSFSVMVQVQLLLFPSFPSPLSLSGSLRAIGSSGTGKAASRHEPAASLSAVDFEARADGDMADAEMPAESCHQSHRALALMLFRHNQAVMHR